WLASLRARISAAGFENFEQHIVWEEMMTPRESAAEGLFGGGSFGIAPTLLQSAHFRPQVVVPGVRGLYRTGASVHPGGGVPIVMKSAHAATAQICTDFAHSIPKGRNREHEQSFARSVSLL
ncbi:MAG: hypothetical protein ACRC5C_07755, partial [Bacilli bacterium]